MAATPQFDGLSSRRESTPISRFTGPATADTMAILEQARRRRKSSDYAGDVTPIEALELINAGTARLIDVRTAEERKFVGYVPDSIPVPWVIGTAFTRNPHFLLELEAKVRKDEILLFFCRSGALSVLAAQAAARAQFSSAYHVLEGFEGEIDAHRRRGIIDGWRFHGLPWVQE